MESKQEKSLKRIVADTSMCIQKIGTPYRQCSRRRGHGERELYCRQHAKQEGRLQKALDEANHGIDLQCEEITALQIEIRKAKIRIEELEAATQGEAR